MPGANKPKRAAYSRKSIAGRTPICEAGFGAPFTILLAWRRMSRRYPGVAQDQQALSWSGTG